MKRTPFYILSAIIIVSLSAFAIHNSFLDSHEVVKDTRPNIIIILADDSVWIDKIFNSHSF